MSIIFTSATCALPLSLILKKAVESLILFQPPDIMNKSRIRRLTKWVNVRSGQLHLRYVFL